MINNKYIIRLTFPKRKKFFIVIALCFCFLHVCVLTAGPTDSSRSELIQFYEGLYHNTPPDCPAKYAVNLIACRQSWLSLTVLKGNIPSNQNMQKNAVEYLNILKDKIISGMKWPIYSPPTYEIPYINMPVKIDGKLNDAAWKRALTFEGEFDVGSTVKRNNGVVFKIMWDNKNIFCSIYAPDATKSNAPLPFQGDSLEIFLMPSQKLKCYWEIVIDRDSKKFDGLHINNKNGSFIHGADNDIQNLRYKAINSADHYSVEVAIPFDQIPNYMLGNPPQQSETIFFALLRTDKNDKEKKLTISSAFPLLYGGHNIFGYAKGILNVQSQLVSKE